MRIFLRIAYRVPQRHLLQLKTYLRGKKWKKGASLRNSVARQFGQAVLRRTMKNCVYRDAVCFLLYTSYVDSSNVPSVMECLNLK